MIATASVRDATVHQILIAPSSAFIQFRRDKIENYEQTFSHAGHLPD